MPTPTTTLASPSPGKAKPTRRIREYQEALRLKPDYAETHYNLGVVLGQRGQTDEAIRHYEEALTATDLRRGPQLPRHRLLPARPHRRGHPRVPGSPETQAGLCRCPQEPGRSARDQSPFLAAGRRLNQPLNYLRSPEHQAATKNQPAPTRAATTASHWTIRKEMTGSELAGNAAEISSPYPSQSRG